MALVVYDRVQETTATTGTGSITLGGAVGGYQSFAVIGNGNTTYYCIVNGVQWEVGLGTYSTTGPTLARTTVFSNSNGNTSPITLSGSSNVFVTYPAEYSVTQGSALGTPSSATLTNATGLPISTGVSGLGSFVAAALANTLNSANGVIAKDTNSNISANNFLGGYNVITAAGTTTVLTVASAYYQRISGSTTQTIQLPVGTSVSQGQGFTFDNDSSGVVTIVDSASTTIDTVPSGGYSYIFCEDNSTSAGSWGKYALLPASYDFSTTTANFGTATLTNGTWNGNTISTAYGGTGLTTFTAANNALYSTSAGALAAGTLPVLAGGTGVTTSTGSGSNVLSTSPVLTTPNLGTPSAIVLTNATSVPVNQATGTLAVANGGTGQTAFTSGYIHYGSFSTSSNLFWDSTNSRLGVGTTSPTYRLQVTNNTDGFIARLTGGAASTVNLGFYGNSTSGFGSMGTESAHPLRFFTGGVDAFQVGTAGQWGIGGATYGSAGQVFTSGGASAAPTWTTPATGTVTSVATAGTVSGLTLTGGTITTTGTITLGGTLSVLPSNFSSQTANTFLAAPNGSAGTPTFRAIVAADVPTLNQNTTGTAGGLSGTPNITVGTITGGATTLSGQLAVNNTVYFNTGTGASQFNDLNIGGVGGWAVGEAHGINTYYGTIASPTIFSRFDTYWDGSNASFRWKNLYYGGPTTATVMTLTAASTTVANLSVTGSITGSSFSGAGTGLTGSASGLSIGGNAATATTATTATNQSGGTVSATTGSFSGTLTLTKGGSGPNTFSALNASGDITTARSSTSGVIFLGTSGNNYVYYDGTNYNMPNGQLYVNGTQAVLNSGTWSINVTGSAGSATTASTATNLSGGTVSATTGSFSGLVTGTYANGSPGSPSYQFYANPASGAAYYLANRASSTTGEVGYGLLTAGSLSWLMYMPVSSTNLQWYNGSSVVMTLTSGGALSATSFSGAGTGLTGTASSLSIGGNATTATTATNWGTYGAVPAAGLSFGNANTIGRSDASGYTYFYYINSNTPNNESGSSSISQIITTNGSDNFYRKANISNLTSAVQSNASGTWGINISGNAATASNGVPAGVIAWFGATTAPSGYLVCNGASLSTTTYATLFAVIGYNFGGSGGSFNLPDLRGYFVRGWDNGRGVDSGRGFGSNQGFAMQTHRHAHGTDGASNGGYAAVGYTDSTGYTIGSGNQSGGGGYSNNTTSTMMAQTAGGTVPTGASETRPVNIALLPCIKY